MGLCVWFLQKPSTDEPSAVPDQKPTPEMDSTSDATPRPETDALMMLRPESEASTNPEPEPEPEAKPSVPKAPKKETWCFVGEDLSGRYCVQVPSEKACTSDRVHPSRSACEMVISSHMPAGIMRNGVGFRPLASMNFHDDSLRNTNP